ncbi:Rieske (2Fe-2S) protein [Streptomyces lusitanus]|uniref:Cytochrome bc1 complex Rieske iron-sulfur subunit n=1 Tax=Streptomyces lusitanus TaxID=68232 RepID=A0ABU3K1P5_9ACTN|nr:Rieske (2Fe-2S) protein [Streptomyces lusitanus]
MTVSFQPASGPARRTVVAAAGAAGLAVALTACGGSDDDASAAPAQSGGAADDATNGGGTGGSSGGDAAGGGTPLASTADIPEGGGKVFADQKVVVVQPSAGEFKAYSATCTHQGCAVKSVSDGLINCPCHNSNFSVADGSVSSGPATKPLPAVQITVDGDSITLA